MRGGYFFFLFFGQLHLICCPYCPSLGNYFALSDCLYLSTCICSNTFLKNIFGSAVIDIFLYHQWITWLCAYGRCCLYCWIHRNACLCCSFELCGPLWCFSIEPVLVAWSVTLLFWFTLSLLIAAENGQLSFYFYTRRASALIFVA